MINLILRTEKMHKNILLIVKHSICLLVKSTDSGLFKPLPKKNKKKINENKEEEENGVKMVPNPHLRWPVFLLKRELSMLAIHVV